MTNKWSKLIAISVGGIFFITHLIFTSLYLLPINPLTKYYQPEVDNYMEPYFTQRWLLFAPEPATNSVKLWYRTKSNNRWSHWLDPIAPILKKHQHFRITYNAKLLYVYENIPKDLSATQSFYNEIVDCSQIKASLNCISVRKDSVMRSKSFKTALKFVMKDHNESQSKIKTDSIQIMTIQIYPKQYSDRKSNKPFGFANVTEYPAIVFTTNLKQ